MPPDENGRRIRVVLHGLGHSVREILLVRRVLDDGHRECIEEPQRLSVPANPHALDHLLVRDLERLGVAGEQKGQEHCGEYMASGRTVRPRHTSMLRVGVDAGSGVAFSECVPEQRGACGLFQTLSLAMRATWHIE